MAGKPITATPAGRVGGLDWTRIEADLWETGHARSGPLLSAAECAALRGMFAEDGRFRKRIRMERYRYGAGEYAYFSAPLPSLVRSLRTGFYRRLAPLANRWVEALGNAPRGAPGDAPRAAESYPAALKSYLGLCHAAGQTRPTPLLLRYTEGGHNRLHQDRYGALSFPFQVVILLSRPEEDFEGGALLLVENRPREQSLGEAIAPAQGEAVIFPNAFRPVRGKRGWLRAGVRHGVSTVTRGTRMTLGIIFHDAE
ncbi:MAG: 2OG-Fe(II) oxygenase [bacterium]